MKQNLSFLTDLKPELEQFSEFLLKWQKSVNLISPQTIPNLWERHILDSAQLYPFIPTGARTLLDMGSGAGFPGLILALFNHRLSGSLEQIYLVESDQKKCVFLTEAARVLNIPVTVLNRRLEKLTLSDVGGQPVDVVTARALASVPVLVELSQAVRGKQTTCLFLKGEQVYDEMQGLKNPTVWQIDYVPSVSDKTGVIVQMRGVLK